jgi:hypothetical protein
MDDPADNELLLVLVRSLLDGPLSASLSEPAILTALADADGSVERAAEALRRGGGGQGSMPPAARPPTHKRARGSTVADWLEAESPPAKLARPQLTSDQLRPPTAPPATTAPSALARLMAAPSPAAPSKPASSLPPLLLATSKLLSQHLPCVALPPSPLPPKLASALFCELMEDSQTWTKNQYVIGGRRVESPHTVRPWPYNDLRVGGMLNRRLRARRRQCIKARSTRRIHRATWTSRRASVRLPFGLHDHLVHRGLTDYGTKGTTMSNARPRRSTRRSFRRPPCWSRTLSTPLWRLDLTLASFPANIKDGGEQAWRASIDTRVPRPGQSCAVGTFHDWLVCLRADETCRAPSELARTPTNSPTLGRTRRSRRSRSVPRASSGCGKSGAKTPRCTCSRASRGRTTSRSPTTACSA